MTVEAQTADAVDSVIDAELAKTSTTEPTEITETKDEDAPAEQKTPKTYTEEDIRKYERDLARENKRIAKRTAQYYQEKGRADQLAQQIAELQKKAPQTVEPDIKNYTDYNQYQKDLINYQIKQNAPAEKQAQPAQDDLQKALWRQQRAPALVSQVQAASQTFPDIQQKMQANVQLLDSLPQHVQDAFLEADNGALAIYQLLEDGMVPHLTGMNADTVQALIERAEDKALSKQKPATKAPAPMTAARGTAPGSKSPETMTPDELRKNGWA